ncbi:diacylglycerol kinase [Parahaliea maris]|uniref:Diacylglycerol kinase n=2 Tax=Parahaliea maris TaxID=2716870 RepID=A0A5C8ZRE8_9GAMM|nr:diacylglycerol kinase [Parahaliea maris]
MNKPGKRGLTRLLAATRHSRDGLVSAWRSEEAFRTEAVLALAFLPLAFAVGDGLAHQLVLVVCCALVILAEILNTAIESVVDRIGPEHDPLSGQAKDLGSAAVLVSLLLFALAWGLSLWQWWQG